MDNPDVFSNSKAIVEKEEVEDTTIFNGKLFRLRKGEGGKRGQNVGEKTVL
jgi:hypothetical protein